jgi:autotransporter-associated beta strand protein
MFKRRQRILILAVSMAAPTMSAFAQTSDTWAVDVGTLGGNWSAPGNWAHGVVPDGGGTVLFTTLPVYTTAPLNIVVDQPTFSVSKVQTDTLITYLVKPSVATNTLTLTGGATIETLVPSINTISTTTFGQLFQIGIAGTSGLTKEGPGTATLWANVNTYTGGTRVNNGVLVLRQIGDSGLGAASGSLSFDGGTLRVTTGSLTTSRAVVINSGGGTIEATTTGTTTLNGSLSGPGNLYKMGGRHLNLNIASTHSGDTNVLAGTLVLASSGALNNTSSLVVRDAIQFDNTATNLTNRVVNSVPVTFQGSNLFFTGNASAASSETFGNTTFSRGNTLVSAVPGAGQSAAISFGNVSRDTGGTAFFRGTGLGSALGANTSNITFATPPTLVGGAGATATSVSIIPWASGSTSATATLSTAGFVTYGANGVRPLDVATEYVATIGAAAAQDNVRITASEAVSSAKTINALLVGTGGGVTGSGTLTVTSGALLNVGANTSIAANLDFGSAEAIITAPANVTLSGVIAGSGGLTKQGPGSATLSGASTYTGTTTVGGGTVMFTSSLPSGSASPLGQSTSAIVLAPAGTGTGGNTGRLAYGGASSASVDRNLNVTGRVALNNAAIVPGFGVATAQSLTMNGTINLDATPLGLIGTAGSTLVLNGKITGSGPITEIGTNSTSVIQINNTNTFDGGVEMQAANWQIGADNALGTGMIKLVQLSGAPTIQAVGGPRSIGNEIVSFSNAVNMLNIGGSQDLTFTGSINLSGSVYTHTINNTALTTYAGVLHTGGFTKAGAGTLVLTGNNIYAGSTTISSGVLRATSSGAMGTSGGPTFVASGAALEFRNNALTAEPATINGTGVGGTGAINSFSGNNSLGNVTLAGNAAIGVASGQLTAGNVDAATGAESFTKVGPGTLVLNRVRSGAATVDEGKVQVVPGRDTAKTSIVTSFTINTSLSARFDLGDNDLIINYASVSPITTIFSYLQSGYAGGGWTGAGLMSSVAAATPGTGIGYVEASDLFTSFPATFNGTSVDSTSLLISFTKTGDANLDRQVNQTDFDLVAPNLGMVSGATWFDGDFDYDGDVDGTDIAMMPEPTSATVLLAFAGIALRRRRR